MCGTVLVFNSILITKLDNFWFGIYISLLPEVKK